MNFNKHSKNKYILKIIKRVQSKLLSLRFNRSSNPKRTTYQPRKHQRQFQPLNHQFPHPEHRVTSKNTRGRRPSLHKIVVAGFFCVSAVMHWQGQVKAVLRSFDSSRPQEVRWPRRYCTSTWLSASSAFLNGETIRHGWEVDRGKICARNRGRVWDYWSNAFRMEESMNYSFKGKSDFSFSKENVT